MVPEGAKNRMSIKEYVKSIQDKKNEVVTMNIAGVNVVLDHGSKCVVLDEEKIKNANKKKKLLNIEEYSERSMTEKLYHVNIK